MLIKVENLSHIYSDGTPFKKIALDNVSLEIDKGEFVGIIGQTGSGKSTLIQHLNGLLTPSSGKISFEGEDIWADKKKLRQIRFNVGLVFQFPEYQLFEETIYKDIAFGPKNMGLDDMEVDKRVRNACKFVGLPFDMAGKSPFNVSGGQRRRIAIAGVIAMEPKVLILDEPAAGLDPKGRDDLLKNIKSYQKQVGNTVILVSHSMEDVANNVSKIFVMDKGGVALCGTPREIFSQSEKIFELGLDIPEITKVFKELKKRGLEVDENIFNIEDGKREILKLLEKRGKLC